MSPTIRVLLGLVLGLAAGAAATHLPALSALTAVIEPVGTVWLSALRMTIIPLVVSLLVPGVAALCTTAAGGPVGRRILVVMLGMLGAAGLCTAVAAPLFLEWIPVNDSTAAALRSTLRIAHQTPAPVPGFGEWVSGLIPTNPVEAAARGAMLPLMIFSLSLGLAAARLQAESRDRLLGFFRSLGEAMMVIVQWVLVLAPVGIFALTFPLGAGAGIRAMGALGYYVILLSVLCLLATVVLYPLTVVLTGMPLQQFARSVARAQALAFSTRSSVASLPAMLESAQARLGVPAAVSGLALPLTVSLMRITSPIVILAAAVFAAAAYGIAVSPAQVAAAAVVGVLTSLGEAGLPGQTGMITSYTPAFLMLGVPLEMLGLLLAVETIPDTFATVGNVTADMAATAIIAHGRGAFDHASTAGAFAR